MAAQIISFLQRSPPPARDWSQQEIAEFYRVESALVQAGVQLESDRGLSDEGDPWFIFCRLDNGEVFIHFARIDGLYVVDGAAFDQAARGSDFSALIRDLIARYPLSKTRERAGSNIFMHPATFLIALVGAAFFHTNEAKAAEPSDSKVDHRRHVSTLLSTSGAPPLPSTMTSSVNEIDSGQAAAILLSAILVMHEDALRLPREIVVADTFSQSVENLALVGVPGLMAPFDMAAATLPELAGHALPVDLQSMLDKAVTPSDAAQATNIQGGGTEAILGSAPQADPNDFGATVLILETPAPPADSGASKPLFIFKSASTPAPAVEAVTILASTLSLSEVIAKSLPQIDKLPTSLSDLIIKGEHVDGAASPSTPATPSAPGAPTGVGGLPAPHSHDPAIDAAIAQFVAQVKHVDMILQGNAVVLYDTDIFSPFARDLDLDSVTFTFDDGSSISLVGTVPELRHFHWAH